MNLTFVEMSWFTQRLKVRMSDEDYHALQAELLDNPQKGKPMPGCGGLRKVRAGQSSFGKGKRGGMRIVYLLIPEAFRIDLFDVYGKDEKDDLSQQEKRDLAAMVAQVRQEAVQAYRRQRGGT